MKPLLFLFLIFAIPLVTKGQVTILENAHSHNDYTRQTPLFDAINLGFKSIEADIVLINDDLYVAHNMPVYKNRITLPDLEEAYLYPLDSLVERGGGSVYSDSEGPLLLLIDIKTDGKATFEVLNDQLFDYRNILIHTVYGEKQDGAVLAVISGNRPIEAIQNAKVRMAAIDGRPEDLGKGYSSEVMPLISQRYSKVIKWKGKGDIKPKELNKLKSLVEAAHAEGKLVRLWASPEDEKVWKVLLDAGVDLINTDEVERLKRFLDERKKNN